MTQLSRRGLLRLGAGAAAVAGVAGLAGCGGSRAAQGIRPRTLKLPTELPIPKVPGARVSPVDGVPVAYPNYPTKPFRSVASTPARGGAVRTLQILYGPPPPARDRNPWWRELERRLGTRIEPTLVPDASLADKLMTTIASGDLPELTYIHLGLAPAALRVIRQGAFTELTPYLGGDAARDFPNLARIPSYAWRNSSIEGGLFGVPRVIPLANGYVGIYRRDWARKLGYPEPPTNAEELLEVFTAFSKGDPDGNGKDNTWALGNVEELFFRQMFRVPEKWRVEKGGRLTYKIETDEFEAALRFMRRCWKAGVFHPDAPNMEYQKFKDLFDSGRTGYLAQGHMGLFGPSGDRGLVKQAVPEADPEPLVPPGHDGGDAQIYQGPGFFGTMAIPSKVGEDPERVRELLRVLDYFAAPFGSEEYVFMNYGIEGKQFRYDDHGNPIPVEDDGVAAWSNLDYMCQPTENVCYYPDAPSEAMLAQRVLTEAVPISKREPTTGLVSNLNISREPVLKQYDADFLTQIVTGSRPLSALREWRAGWRQRGGQQVREELEESLQRAG